MSLLFFLKPIYRAGSDDKVRYPKAIHLSEMRTWKERKKEEEEEFSYKALLLLMMED